MSLAERQFKRLITNIQVFIIIAVGLGVITYKTVKEINPENYSTINTSVQMLSENGIECENVNRYVNDIYLDGKVRVYEFSIAMTKIKSCHEDMFDKAVKNRNSLQS